MSRTRVSEPTSRVTPGSDRVKAPTETLLFPEVDSASPYSADVQRLLAQCPNCEFLFVNQRSGYVMSAEAQRNQYRKVSRDWQNGLVDGTTSREELIKYLPPDVRMMISPEEAQKVRQEVRETDARLAQEAANRKEQEQIERRRLGRAHLDARRNAGMALSDNERAIYAKEAVRDAENHRSDMYEYRVPRQQLQREVEKFNRLSELGLAHTPSFSAQREGVEQALHREKRNAERTADNRFLDSASRGRARGTAERVDEQIRTFQDRTSSPYESPTQAELPERHARSRISPRERRRDSTTEETPILPARGHREAARTERTEPAPTEMAQFRPVDARASVTIDGGIRRIRFVEVPSESGRPEKLDVNSVPLGEERMFPGGVLVKRTGRNAFQMSFFNSEPERVTYCDDRSGWNYNVAPKPRNRSQLA